MTSVLSTKAVDKVDEQHRGGGGKGLSNTVPPYRLVVRLKLRDYLFLLSNARPVDGRASSLQKDNAERKPRAAVTQRTEQKRLCCCA